MSAILLSDRLKSLDPFGAQKRDAFVKSLPAITALGSYIVNLGHTIDAEKVFSELFHVALWGNRCDLSISAGASNHQTHIDPIGQAAALQCHILRDDTSLLWNHLKSLNKQKPCRVDFVLDNAGFELFTDLCLADFLTSYGIVSHICFHAKRLPWFVSDVTPLDWSWTLDELANTVNDDSSTAACLRELGNRLKARLADETWDFTVHSFWTLPCDFTQMQSVAPDLYSNLSASDLILFKGDLNYRKLVGDLCWSPMDSFERALRGFSPAPLCCLRTLKCDVVVGLNPGQAEAMAVQRTDWMLSGDYAVIQLNLP
jgi:uncharacterized protein with ATP-grasp and redox domains